jgi:hypothetical protein
MASTFDNLAAAVDWLDYYRARSLRVLDLYAEDANIICGCRNGKRLNGRPLLRSYWVSRFEEKPALDLIDLEDWRAGIVAVSYRTNIDIVRAILSFDMATGLITHQRCGPL